MDARVEAINAIFIKAAVVECYDTGRPVGGPIETAAIAGVFGDVRVHITSVKPNLGHGGGASGMMSLIKSVLALEQQTIPSNIKFSRPFKERSLTVPFRANIIGIVNS
ncbi:beta-ketoacyl synthase [Trichoderma sp. SZMC 28011]